MSSRPRGALPTAAWALSAYRGTTLVLGAMSATALAAALPVAVLMRSVGDRFESRLLLALSGGASIDPTWTLARSPESLQTEALGTLFQAAAGAAAAALAVGALGAVLVFAARAVERAGEVTLRRAVGASRRTLLLAAVIEAGAVAVAALCVGGLAGLALARWAARAWPGALTPFRTADVIPGAVSAGSIGLVLLAGALLALVFAPRRLVDSAPRAVSLAVPTIQLGLALILLTASGLLTRHTSRPDLTTGPHPDGEVVRGGASAAEAGTRSAQYADLLARLRAGVTFDTVSLAGDGAAIGLGTLGVVTTDCGMCPAGGVFVPWHSVAAMHQVVSADTFKALGIRLVAGRGITDDDRWDASPVAVVSRSLAIRHFQNGDAIGRRLLFGDDPRRWHTVVGVVEDPRPTVLGGAAIPPFAVYGSVLQHPAPTVELLLRPRAGVPLPAVIPNVVLQRLGGARGVTAVSETALRAAERAPVGWFGTLFELEGLATLLIAVVATGVQMRLWVRSLSPELGLRRALGAGRTRMASLVVARAALVAVGGVAVALALGPSAWSALGTVVRGLPTWDLGLLARFAGLLVGVAVLSAAMPAWRLLRAPPASLLTGSNT
jgi:putative ABC transport system permease protein